jgi:hypothetical protein
MEKKMSLATVKDHSSYDDFWQKNSATSKRYQTCSYDGRGWFDAEDLYGPLNTYQAIEKTNKNTIRLLWDHGVMEIGQKWSQSSYWKHKLWR